MDILAPSRRRINPGGCLIAALVVGILAFILLMIFGVPRLTGYYSEGTRPIPGDASHFDPVATFSEVRTYAGNGAQLVSMRAYYVRADGTLDVSATYHPHVDYQFVRQLATPPPDAPPIGAGGSVDQKWFQTTDVTIREPAVWSVESSGSSYDYYDYGMSHDIHDPSSSPVPTIPAPACPFRTLWNAALKHGARADAVATIDVTGQGYDFSISGTSVQLLFGADCQILNGDQ